MPAGDGCADERGGEPDVVVPIHPVRIGDVVRLKKQHPCGSNEWEITRLGMDVWLTCKGCERKVRLMRYDFDRRFKGFASRAGEDSSEH